MLTKYLTAIAVVAAFAGGSFFGVKFLTKKCPDCTFNHQCVKPDPCPPCNGIDFDKIKSKAITIQNTQHLTVKGDSLLDQKLKVIIQEELAKAKIARCKNW